MSLPPGAPEPAFTEPWHAQLFALTVRLNETGEFAWSDWAARFSETLKQQGMSKDLDGGDDYFQAWLVTLETLLDEAGHTDASEAGKVKAAWIEAYLTTPHGAAVQIKD